MDRPAATDAGGSATYSFCYSPMTLNTQFNVTVIGGLTGSGATEDQPAVYPLTAIVLPNGKSYTFTYDPHFGDLRRIDLPTGGYISYEYSVIGWDTCSTSMPVKRAVVSRTISDSASVPSTWHYRWYNGVCNGSGSPVVIVTNPDQNDEMHYAVDNTVNGGPLIRDVISYQGAATVSAGNVTGTILKKIETTQSSNISIFWVSTPDVLDGDGLHYHPGYLQRQYFPTPVLKSVTTMYAPDTQAIQTTQETDYTIVPPSGSVPWYKPDQNPYAPTQAGYSYGTCACIIYSEIASETVHDYVTGGGSAGPVLRTTQTGYRFQDTDGQAYAEAGLTGLSSNVTIQDENNSQAAKTTYQYDEPNYSAGVVAGEPTTTQRWAGGTTWISSHTKFNVSGVYAGSIDAIGTATSITAYDCANAFPSSMTVAADTSLAETSSYVHDCNTGAVTSHTDPNGQSTSYTYADSLGRITAVHNPDGGSVQVTYTDGPDSSVNIVTATGGTQGAMSQTVVYDGLGRTVDVQFSAPEGTIHQTAVYDAMGRVSTRSNPYRSGSDATYGLAISKFDELGRPSVVTNPDGTSKSYNYSGQVTTSTDENGHSQSSKIDGLGQLIQVTESNAAITTYVYDGLGNLTQVTQPGLDGETTRHRNFHYDFLSHLVTSTNPETGTICYGQWSNSQCINGYDANGNLRYKTDARGVTTTYTYDALNRLTGKTYSDGTPSVAYDYDQTASWNGIPRANTVGRLWHTTTGANTSHWNERIYSYDSMGRVAQILDASPLVAGSSFHTISANYDLAGNMTSLTYPDGRVVQQGYDAAGRMSSVNYQSWNGTAVNQPYLTASASDSYDPAGHLVNATFGNGVAFGAGYDNRERVHSLLYGPSTAPLWNKQYAYTPNSNLKSYTDLITGVQRQFGYDSLNRLMSAQDFMSSNAGDGSSTTAAGTAGCTATIGAASSAGASPQWTDPDDSNIFTDADQPNDGNWSLGSATVVTNAVIAPDGSMTAMSVSAQNGGGFFAADRASNPIIVAGNSVTASVWLKNLTGSSQTVTIYLLQGDANGYGVLAAKTVTATSSWQPFVLTGVTSSSVNQLITQIGEGGFDTTGQAFAMWNLTLQDSGTAAATTTNWLPYSQRFTTSSWNKTNVTAADNTATAPDGTRTAATLTLTSSDGWFIDNFLWDPLPFSGVPVTGSMWARSPSGAQNVQLYLIENGSAIQSQTVPLTTDWQRIQISGPAQNVMGYLSLQIGAGSPTVSGRTVEVWGAQLEMSSQAGPYIATGAAAVSSGTNFTNLLPYSQQLNGPSWSYANVGYQASTQAAPDGSGSASQITIGQALPYGYFTNDVAHPSLYDGLTVTASVYLQSQSGAQSVNLYLVAVNAGGTVILGPQVVNLNSAWQRFSLSRQLPTGLTRLYFQISENQSGAAFNVWGTQMEIAPTAGPYVATSALPVIAGKDLVNLLPSSQPMNGGTWSYSSVGVALNGAQAPDGSNTATVATAAPDGQDSGLADTVMNPSLYDGQQVTASVYLRVPSGSHSLNLYLFNNGNVAQMQIVTVTSAWQRFQVTATNQNGLQSLYFQIGGGGSFTNGQVLQIWGPQLMLGSSPGVYEPTSCTSTSPSTGQPATLSTQGLNESYAYDSFGNILQNGGFNATYTANNQMFGYAYDAAGNLLSNGVTPLTWDAESRLTSAAGASYIYDPEGNRVEKAGVGITDTIYFGGRPIARLSAGQWTDLIYGPTGLLAEVPGTQSGAPVYRVTDHLGTTVGNLTADGRLINPLDYRPFGGVFSGNTDDPYLFTGKEKDPESGLDYFGARYYGSTMGRWISSDYNDDPQPIPFAQLSNPQTLNLYSYVVNNPVSLLDADGHTTHCPGGGDGIVKSAQPCYDLDPTNNNEVRPNPRMFDGRVNPGDIGLSWIVGGKLGKLLGEGALGFLNRLIGRTGGEALGQVLAKLSPAEKAFVEELEKAGHKVTPIARGAGQTADFLVDGVEMELKTVMANGPNSIKNAIETASTQTARGQIVIDARGSAATVEAATSQIHRAAGNVGESALRGRVSVMTKSGTVKF